MELCDKYMQMISVFHIEPGTKVLIREDLVANTTYGNDLCTNTMIKWRGLLLTIEDIQVDAHGNVITFNLKEDDEGWFWTPEMCQKIGGIPWKSNVNLYYQNA